MRKIDETWIANRKLYRPRLKGSELKIDPETGYLTTTRNVGLVAKKKVVFIERFKLCSNFTAICKSVGVDKMAVLDHLIFDKKFRDDYNACLDITDRAKKLNDAIRDITVNEDKTVIYSLAQKLKDYK